MFSLGRPVLALIIVTAVSGGWIATRDRPTRTDLELWTFAEPHAELYRDLRSQPTPHSHSLEPLQYASIRLIPNSALNIRLVSLFMADRRGSDLPDVVEIRQDAIGRYLSAPTDQVPFLPLNDVLTRDNPGWMDRIVRQRFAPYTKDGRIFGLPRDVHPVALAYRADLFAEAGVDLESPTPGKTHVTWPDFQSRCQAFQAYWRSRGVADRWALDLLAGNAEILSGMLLQRGINLIETDGRVRLDDPVVAETVAFYARLVAGPCRVSYDATSGGVGALRRDLESGLVCAIIAPDWRLADVRDAPGLAGKLRLMRLPRFADNDAPTTTWGGTMVAIPRHCRNPQAAWRLIEAVYLSNAGMSAQARDLGILPAVSDFWTSPAVRRPDPLFGGQAVGALYAELAPSIPRQHLTPETAYASAALGYVLSQAVGAVRTGVSDEELNRSIVGWLAARQGDVQRQIEHGRD